MFEAQRQLGVLTGLVDAGAAALYDRLLQVERMPLGRRVDEFDLQSPPGRELFELGVVSVSGDEAFVRAVSPAVALRLALNRHHRRIQDLQGGLAQGWARFARLAFSNSNKGSPRDDGEDLRIIADTPEITMLAAGLYRSPTRVLRGTIAGGEAARSIDEAMLRPPAEAIAGGVEFRMIYDAEHASTTWGQANIERSAEAGEQARVRKRVPVRMMHVDDAIALVTLGHSTALLVQSQALLALLAEWFDQLWNDPGTTVMGAPPAMEMTQVRRKVLCLLVSGLTDEAIAHRTGTSVRTIRRHIKAIIDLLGVDTRFAAGAAAAKLGWV